MRCCTGRCRDPCSVPRSAVPYSGFSPLRELCTELQSNHPSQWESRWVGRMSFYWSARLFLCEFSRRASGSHMAARFCDIRCGGGPAHAVSPAREPIPIHLAHRLITATERLGTSMHHSRGFPVQVSRRKQLGCSRAPGREWSKRVVRTRCEYAAPRSAIPESRELSSSRQEMARWVKRRYESTDGAEPPAR